MAEGQTLRERGGGVRGGPWGWIKALSWRLQSQAPQASVGGLGQTWYLVTKRNSTDLLYVEWGRSLGPRGHCRHSALWQWGERREDTRAPRGSVLSYDRHRPNHNIQGKGTQFTTLVGRSEVATWQFLWKRSSTGKTTVSRSELAEERSSEVDLQKMIFLHREDQSIQFSRKFY